MSVDGCSVGDVTETTAGAAASLVRRARGLRQDAVARTAGIAQGTLSKFENGLVALDRTHLSALAVALDIPLSRLTDSAPTEAAVSACAFHRKRSTLPVSEANRTCRVRRSKTSSARTSPRSR
jgi:transcriptional regulator with XRE-family HTH domain